MAFFIQVTPILNPKAREWCKMPYPGHPKGCPNFNTGKKECPPDAPMFDDFFDMSGDFWMGVEKFELGEHVKRMIALHPDWTDKQARCCLYWQNGVRKRLRTDTELFISLLLPDLINIDDGDGEYDYTMLPEAMGMNVIATALRHDIPIKARPVDAIHKISIVGRRLKHG